VAASPRHARRPLTWVEQPIQTIPRTARAVTLNTRIREK